MSDTVEQIKSRLDIVDIISGYLKVQKAGVNYKARCPFHNEKTPSFHISPERQSWHCFGCNKGGDMFSFLQEIEGIEFVEALRLLATRAGMPLPQYQPEQGAAKQQRVQLLAVVELATKFFEKQLWHSTAGARALEYLRGRGLTDETIRAWRLGWAPNDWQALTGFLQQQPYHNADIVAAGVAIDKQGRPYDRFRSRIMFPIADVNGQIVGFTGRVFGAEVAVGGEPPAKYVNTPQSLLYDKSRILFGLDKAKLEMRSRDACLLVEGNVDAILSWQAGASHVVATSGTALTPHQLRMLARYSMNLDFCFDTDAAGQTATRRGIALALAQSFTVRVVTIPDASCKDPADYVQKYATGWQEVVGTAKPILQYYYDRATAAFDPSSAESKRAIMHMMGPFIKRLTSQVERSHWTGQLAMLLRTEQTNVEADIARLTDDLAQYDRLEESSTHMSVPPIPTAVDPLSEEVLALLVRAPELASHVTDIAESLDAPVKRIVQNPALLASQSGFDDATDPLLTLALQRASIRAGEWYGVFTIADCTTQLAVVRGRIRERDLRTRCNRIQLDIRQAEQMHDSVRMHTLLEEFQQCSQELSRIQSIS